jgi:hypothetical protein
MKERPILFSTPMIPPILEGRKRMTRRVIKPQPTGDFLQMARDEYLFGEPNDFVGGKWIHCFYGQPGDRLWVRETCGIATGHMFDGKATVQYFADCHVASIDDDRSNDYPRSQSITKTRPSIFMPRWASRILLVVKSIRVERVQDISGQDCVDEGIDPLFGRKRSYSPSKTSRLCREAFRDLWNSINAKRGYGWDVNPWVWVIEFKRITL